jgi:uncharacterized DUF497 family protein
VRWIWDPAKNRRNKRDHGLSLDTASLVFEDRLAMSRPDDSVEEERWQTVGMVGNVILFVVHTEPQRDHATGELTGRIISARKATSHERRAYEEGAF